MKVLILLVALIAVTYSQSPVEPAVEPAVEPVVEPAVEPAEPAEVVPPEVVEPTEPAPVEPVEVTEAAVAQEVPVTELVDPEAAIAATAKPTASPPGDGYLAGCLAPNGGGLQAALNDFSQFIPAEQLYRRIIKAISTDSETQQVLTYVSSPEFHDLLVEVIRTPELTAFADFACQDLFLDVRYYFNMLLSLFGLPEFPRVTARTSPGFRGLFLDMLDMIPTEKLKILLNERMTTDIYLKQAYDKLQSPQFTNFVSGLHNSTVYNEMLMGLRELQVDVDIVLATIHRSIM